VGRDHDLDESGARPLGVGRFAGGVWACRQSRASRSGAPGKPGNTPCRLKMTVMLAVARKTPVVPLVVPVCPCRHRPGTFGPDSIDRVPSMSRQTHIGLAYRALRTPVSASEREDNQRLIRIHLAEERRNHLHITVSIFKGITLGAAAYGLLGILSANGTLDTRVQVTALVFWLASFLAMIVTYDGMMLSSLLAITAPNAIDLFIPFLLAITEFSLFPILVPVSLSGVLTRSSAAALAHLAWWPLGLAIFILVGSLDLINSQAALTATMEELPPDIQPFLHRVRSLLRKNQYATAGSLALYIAVFLVLRFGVPHIGILNRLPSAAQLRKWEGVLGLFVIANNVFGIWTIEQTRHELAEALASDSGDDSYYPDEPEF
jgi:hypothetical protein